MNSQEFIDLLEEREILSGRLIDKMREKLEKSGGKLPAKSLAKFLVQKKHLPHQLAVELLNEPLDDDVEDTDEAESADDEGSASDSNVEKLAPIEDLADRSAIKMSAAKGELMEDPLVADVTLSSPSGVFRTKPKRRPKPESRERIKTKQRKTRSKRSSQRKSEWDSPLLLFGGGGLILLVLCGVTVWYLLFRDTGDDQIQLARSAMDQGSYSQAISQYEKFLEDFPNHPEQSPARVELGMARLRRSTEGRSDFKLALQVADTEIKEVEREESFTTAHDELATLLPQIARGLATQADNETDPAAAGELVELTKRALELCANAKYVPRNLRDDSELLEIRAVLDRVGARQQSYTNLQETLATMQQAVEAGDTRTAYETHQEHLKKHPEQATEPALIEMVEQTSAAEQAGIRFVREEQSAERSERPSPMLAELALANRRGGAPSTAKDVVCFHVRGALYGLDAESGRLLWRRFTGFDDLPFVVKLDQDVFVRDARHNELLRLSAKDGKLIWRHQFEKQFASPAVLGNKAYVASQSGRLYVLDLESGSTAGYLEFAQPLPIAPAIDVANERLYITGEHSSLYAISLTDLTCLGVYYLGHSPGSIQVPVAPLLNKLAVFENLGVESSQFRLLLLDESGVVSEAVADTRLEGLVQTPSLVAGRRLVVLTDRGQINVYEIGPQTGSTAVTLVATRAPAHARPVASYALIAGRDIWVADDRLTKYGVQPTDNRLPVQGIETDYRGDVFIQPLQQSGGTLFHVRQPSTRSGAAVGAMDVTSGRIYWETDLGIPPGAEPLVNEGGQTITLANANGSIFRLGRDAIRSRVQDQPVKAQNQPRQLPNITNGVQLTNGDSLFSSSESSPWVILLSQDGPQSDRWIELAGPVASPPVALGPGFLVPLIVGQVFYLDPTQEDPLVAAFQPRLQPRKTIPWLPAGISPEMGDECVLSDGRESMYLLELSASDPRQLTAAAEKLTGGLPLATGIAVVGNTAFAGTKDARLVAFSLPSLDVSGDSQLSGPIVWGPVAAGDRLLFVTDTNQLYCTNAQGDPVWQIPLERDELAGEPLALGNALLVALRSGVVRKIDLPSGETIGELNTGQPLESGPVVLQGRVVMAAHDSTLLIVEQL